MTLKTRIAKAEVEAQARLKAELKAAVQALNDWIDTNGTPEEQEANTRCLLHHELPDSMLAEINMTRADADAILAKVPKPTPEDEALANGLYARIPLELKARLNWREAEEV